MSRITISKLRDSLAEIIARVAESDERVVVQRRGTDIVALIPLEDLELLEHIEDLIDVEAAEEAIKEAIDKGTISWEDIKKKYGRR